MARANPPIGIVLDAESKARVEHLKYQVPGCNGNVSQLIRESLKAMEREMTDNTTKLPVEILGEFGHAHGEFGPFYKDKLVRRGGKLYLINWMWSGSGELRGEAARPYLFDVREDQLAEITPYFAAGNPDGVYAVDYGHAIAILDGCREIQPDWWAWEYIR